MSITKTNSDSMIMAYVQTTKGRYKCTQESQRHKMSTPHGAVSQKVVFTSLHILFYVGISSAGNFDFLWFREDSEPWISLEL